MLTHEKKIIPEMLRKPDDPLHMAQEVKCFLLLTVKDLTSGKSKPDDTAWKLSSRSLSCHKQQC